MSRILIAVIAVFAIAISGHASCDEGNRRIVIACECQANTPRDQQETRAVYPLMVHEQGVERCFVKNTSIVLDVDSVLIGRSRDSDLTAVKILLTGDSKKRYSDLKSGMTDKNLLLMTSRYVILGLSKWKGPRLDHLLLLAVGERNAGYIRSAIMQAEKPGTEALKPK